MKNSAIKQIIKRYSKGMGNGDVQKLFDLVTIKPDDPDEQLWADNILSAAKVTKDQIGKEKAIKLLVAAYDDYKMSYPNSFQRKVDILRETFSLQMEEGQMKDAHSSMNRYLYNALGQVQFTTSFPKMHYFSFRSISDHSIKEIEKEEISLAHPREFNDPLDTILVWWLNNEIMNDAKNTQDKNFRLLMKKASEHIKLRCLVGSQYKDKKKWKERSIEDLSVLMWAHYAKSHTGMCVEFEFDRSFFKAGAVTDEEEIVMIVPMNYTDKICINGMLSMKDALFMKSNFWEYENEMRLCSFNIKNNEEYPSLKCPGAIKAVYLGVKCKDEDRRKVEKAIGDKDIPLYQMSVDENKLTRLKKIQIG